MKKRIALLLAVILTAVSASTGVRAAGTQVYVTIADEKGQLAVTYASVDVSDADGDGTLTINDALYAAHEKYYKGGAAEGYASYSGEYGLSLSKLWGVENGGSYGYYVNNDSAWSLADPVNNGDHIYAFVYTDTTYWSDAYSWFSKASVSTKAGEEIELQLSYAGFDADWNPLKLPAENAKITVDGQATDIVTDAEGKALISFSDEGSHVISAVSDSLTLVPPVCSVTVRAAGAELPQTGTVPTAAYAAAGLLLAAAGCAIVVYERKREHEI